MPPLIQKWNVLKDEDKDLFPLLEVCVCVPPLYCLYDIVYSLPLLTVFVVCGNCSTFRLSSIL